MGSNSNVKVVLQATHPFLPEGVRKQKPAPPPPKLIFPNAKKCKSVTDLMIGTACYWDRDDCLAYLPQPQNQEFHLVTFKTANAAAEAWRKIARPDLKTSSLNAWKAFTLLDGGKLPSSVDREMPLMDFLGNDSGEGRESEAEAGDLATWLGSETPCDAAERRVADDGKAYITLIDTPGFGVPTSAAVFEIVQAAKEAMMNKSISGVYMLDNNVTVTTDRFTASLFMAGGDDSIAVPGKKAPAEQAAAKRRFELRVPNLVATVLEWLGLKPAARESIMSGCQGWGFEGLMRLLQLSECEIDGLTALNIVDKAELKRWQRATMALAGGEEKDHRLACCGVHDALHMYLVDQLVDQALKIGGGDIKPADIEIESIRVRFCIQLGEGPDIASFEEERERLEQQLKKCVPTATVRELTPGLVMVCDCEPSPSSTRAFPDALASCLESGRFAGRRVLAFEPRIESIWPRIESIAPQPGSFLVAATLMVDPALDVRGLEFGTPLPSEEDKREQARLNGLRLNCPATLVH
eukprot:Transcript_21572.p1 GENE.Transcript_21572~~Transcript_21572.p1  ORF type:complete len:523 (-),score=95.04 Transcript_21572:210-1778(-)